MKRMRVVVLGLVMLSAMVLSAAEQPGGSAEVMVSAASRFLEALSPDQKAKTTFAFEDDERYNWHFIPRPRKGLPFSEMSAAQKHLAYAFLSAGLSQRGYMKAITIMSLEEVLRVLENDSGDRRNTEKYYFSVFGELSEAKTWGWRVEGHHVSLNFTLVNGRLIADSPMFFGSNPAEVKQGPRKGLRVLAREEDLARELLGLLDEKQRAVAIIDAAAPKDILSTNQRKADILENRGLPVAKMNRRQREVVLALLQEYTHNMPSDMAEKRMNLVRQGGLEKVVFAWAGTMERGQGHYYRLQGPTFLIEYDNTQNNANHIHSVWRDFKGDWGDDLLEQHYRNSPHHAGKEAGSRGSQTPE